MCSLACQPLPLHVPFYSTRRTSDLTDKSVLAADNCGSNLRLLPQLCGFLGRVCQNFSCNRELIALVGIANKIITSLRRVGTATGLVLCSSFSSLVFLAKFLMCSSVFPKRSEGFSVPFSVPFPNPWSEASLEGGGWSPFFSPLHYITPFTTGRLSAKRTRMPRRTSRGNDSALKSESAPKESELSVVSEVEMLESGDGGHFWAL